MVQVSQPFSTTIFMQVSQRSDAAAPTPLDSLKNIDWDFATTPSPSPIHSLHPYPAKFIPEIPSALIAELSEAGETVADIFCGSGTTLVEALRAGRRAIGIDANPLACLIARAKTCRLASSRAALDQALERAHRLADHLEHRPMFNHKFTSDHYRPDPKVAEFWFEPFVVEEMAELRNYCISLPEPARAVALTAFSAIVVAVSKQDSDTRYVRRNKSIKPGDTCKKFIRVLHHAIAAHDTFDARIDADDSCTIINGNVLMEPVAPAFDLLVCSPPYPNAYSYHLYHMTRLLWLQMDHGAFKKQEIGSHRKYSSRGRSAATAGTFEGEFLTIMAWITRHLKRRRYACFIVGDSTIRGERISNADIISRAGAAHGLVEVARMNRRMRDSRKAFNPAIGKIKTEDILILQNGR
jgi:site-specific DNA-methyltransferase (cytosine-N4-specific)